MRTIETDVLVIGGGATGAGVAWDAALRGLSTVLLERRDLADGTSGRFHGLLHSGARYVVKDPRAAEECIAENVVLRRVAAATMEDTGGLFVATPGDDLGYADEFVRGAEATGVPVAEVAVDEVLRREPRLNPGIQLAFEVPDASVDAWLLLGALAEGIRGHGGQVLTYHEVVEVHRDGDEVTGATARDARSGEQVRIEARCTVNAAGAWAGQLADMAGCEGVRVVSGKGIMIAMNHRLVNTVVNRLIRPGDGDILVPIRTVSVIGTTDIRAEDPDDLEVTPEEVAEMLDGGERLVPGFRQQRALRVWAGARPLFSDPRAGAGEQDNRDISRAHALLDHREHDGTGRFVTITGGKLTTFRMMAEEAVDAVCRQLGHDRPCTTATTPLPGSEDGTYVDVGARLRAREAHFTEAPELICECEMISRASLEEAIEERQTTNLDDIRRALRLGMGPCQGGVCIFRATGILHDVGRLDGPQANRALTDFVQERWKGTWSILQGDQLRQARFNDWVFQGLLDIEHLPQEQPA